jgi:hypothetical protein
MASKRRVKLEHFRGLIQEGPDEAERGETGEVTREFRKKPPRVGQTARSGWRTAGSRLDRPC